MKVQIIGLGTVGLPTAIHISRFFDAVGYDISPEAQTHASKFIQVANKIENADIYVITVSTKLNSESTPDMSAVDEACKEISKAQLGALVAIESTLSIGTARRLSSKYNLKFVVVCPHRWWKRDQINHGVVQLRVIGALNSESMERGKAFYQALRIPLYPLSSLELAEATKIAENSYRFVQIAFAEELKIIAESNNLNFNELREACNTKWNVVVLEARDGIGGECLPKDIRYLMSASGVHPLLEGAIKADEAYKKFILGE